MPGGGDVGGDNPSANEQSTAESSAGTSQSTGTAGSSGNPGSEEDEPTDDASLEDPSLADPADPSFEQPSFEQPTFEESSENSSSSTESGSTSASGGRPVLDQATLQELEDLLGEELDSFDGTVLSEPVTASGQETGEAGSGGMVFQGFEPGSDDSQTGQNGTSAGGGNNVNVAVPQSQIPPPDPDDDIVARQLREAAMAEPDPVLRERLWQEYYRYTGKTP